MNEITEDQLDKPVINQENNEKYGSIEKATQGLYQFKIGDVISEAWKLTSGTKWDFQMLFFVYFLFFIGALIFNLLVNSLLTISNPDPQSADKIIFEIVYQILYTILFTPLTVAIVLSGVRRACGENVTVSLWNKYYKKLPALVVTLFLSYLMIILGLILFILPGIYLAIAYSYSTTLVAEKNLSPWQALETSRKAIHKRWFSMFAFMILITILIIISTIPFGIGLIWTLPMAMIAYGIIYRNMFGVEAETLREL